MEQVELKKRDVLDVAAGLKMIGGHEPPAPIRIKLARIARVVKPEAEIIMEERTMLLDDYAVFEGDVGSPNRRYKPQVDQNGRPIQNSVELKDKKAFSAAEKALYDSTVTLSLPRLTQEDCEQMTIPNAAQELIWSVCNL